MKHTLTDLSQLSKAMLKAVPKMDEVKPAPPKARQHDDGEEVLAYFSRPMSGAKAAQNVPKCAPAVGGADARVGALKRDVAALRAQLRDSEAARSDAETNAADLERERAKLADALAAARKEVERLKGECGRLQGETRKAALAAICAAEAKAELTVAPATERPTQISPEPRSGEPRSGRYEGCILAPPGAIAETFPGEVREMVLSALSEARDAAHQSTRERRGAILDAVLAANKSSGELERRRAELKQAMKDCGYYTDPHALESLGFRLISGKTHWKLEYAGVRMPIAKTPSDYRANLNMATDLANRCF